MNKNIGPWPLAKYAIVHIVHDFATFFVRFFCVFFVFVAYYFISVFVIY